MNRKKLLIVLTLLSLPIALFAQQKGDKVYSVTGAFAAERMYYYHYPSGSAEADPVDVTIGAGVGIGGFMEDRLFLGVGFNLDYSHIRDYSAVNAFGGQINPFISYYIPITDGVYYTPSLGGLFEIGMLAGDNVENPEYFGWGGYLNMLAFEFRVGPKTALCFETGTLSYIEAATGTQLFHKTSGVGKLSFGFNSLSLSLRYYLR